jgi:hypothetical protein
LNYRERIGEIRTATQNLATVGVGVLEFADEFVDRSRPQDDMLAVRFVPEEALVDPMKKRRDISDFWSHKAFERHQTLFVYV